MNMLGYELIREVEIKKLKEEIKELRELLMKDGFTCLDGLRANIERLYERGIKAKKIYFSDEEQMRLFKEIFHNLCREIPTVNKKIVFDDCIVEVNPKVSRFVVMG